ncbi:hypothetical protein ACFWPV_36835 [Streptomyces uncialis]|uniref:hypothetical protein n=1 Tax=Streptomyces uncialis TaxID=1048205 RepID=UPI0036697229
MAFARESVPTEIRGNNWFCFCQSKDQDGRRLKSNAAKLRSNPASLSKYDFENRAPSWSGKDDKTITVTNRGVAGSDKSCKFINSPIL